MALSIGVVLARGICRGLEGISDGGRGLRGFLAQKLQPNRDATVTSGFVCVKNDWFHNEALNSHEPLPFGPVKTMLSAPSLGTLKYHFPRSASLRKPKKSRTFTGQSGNEPWHGNIWRTWDLTCKYRPVSGWYFHLRVFLGADEKCLKAASLVDTQLLVLLLKTFAWVGIHPEMVRQIQ